MHQCCFVHWDNLNLGNVFYVLESNYRENNELADHHCDVRGFGAAKDTDNFPVAETEILYPGVRIQYYSYACAHGWPHSEVARQCLFPSPRVQKGELLMCVGRLGGQRWHEPASRGPSQRQGG